MNNTDKFFGWTLYQLKFLTAFVLLAASILFSNFALPIPASANKYPQNIFNTLAPISFMLGILYLAYMLGAWRNRSV